MKALFEYIRERLADRVPEIKTVRIWNNQFLYSRGERYVSDEANRAFRKERAFKYPACFIEFVVQDTHNMPMRIVDYDLIVRFRFGIEGYKFERLETFDFCDKFVAAIHLMAATTESGLTFTTFQQVSTEFDEDRDNIEEPVIEYRTRFRSGAGYQKQGQTIVNPGVDTPVDDNTIVPEI